MAITVTIYYRGRNGSARRFVEEMISSGTVDRIRKEEGNIRYRYFASLEDPETILLLDTWESQEALDRHHRSNMMEIIFHLREKYDLHMTVERYIMETDHEGDATFIRK